MLIVKAAGGGAQGGILQRLEALKELILLEEHTCPSAGPAVVVDTALHLNSPRSLDPGYASLGVSNAFLYRRTTSSFGGCRPKQLHDFT
jgi:hypothetical protein